MAVPLIPHFRPSFGPAEYDAVRSALDRGYTAGDGPAGAELCHRLANLTGRQAGVGTASGTAALELALRVIGVAGTEVAVPAYACSSIARAVRRAGARPRPIDVDPDDLALSYDAVPDTCAATVMVHQFGLPTLGITRPSPTPVVEDFTTAVGGLIAGVPVGRAGHLAVTSISATKPLSGGEGGVMLGTADHVTVAGRWIDPESEAPETDDVTRAKLSDLCAAVAIAQLDRLDELIARRAQIATCYDGVCVRAGIHVLRPRPGTTGTWWRYLVAVPPRVGAASAVAAGRARGVTLARPVTTVLGPPGQFPVASAALDTLVSVPVFAALSDAEVEQVASVLAEVFSGVPA